MTNQYSASSDHEYRARFLRRILVNLIVALVLGFRAHGQALPTETFEIEGLVESPLLLSLDSTNVEFEGQGIRRIVKISRDGTYHAQLPVGTYSMTVKAPEIDGQQVLADVVRPNFHVSARSKIVLNVYLDFRPTSCDDAVRADISEYDQEQRNKDNCGGKDIIKDKSSNHSPFSISIVYARRQRTDEKILYMKGGPARARRPVRLAYNLFSLSADMVEADKGRNIFLATGHVTTSDGHGRSRTAAEFRFEVHKGRIKEVGR